MTQGTYPPVVFSPALPGADGDGRPGTLPDLPPLRCADAARRRGEPLHASAVDYSRFLLLEVPGPWGDSSEVRARLLDHADLISGEIAWSNWTDPQHPDGRLISTRCRDPHHGRPTSRDLQRRASLSHSPKPNANTSHPLLGL